jgi:hypothetical protein
MLQQHGGAHPVVNTLLLDINLMTDIVDKRVVQEMLADCLAFRDEVVDSFAVRAVAVREDLREVLSVASDIRLYFIIQLINDVGRAEVLDHNYSILL